MTEQATSDGDEPPFLNSEKLRRMLSYCKKVFALDSLFDGVQDQRKDPEVPTSLLVRSVFLCGLLRIRSFNALEPKLGEAPMQRALGCPVGDGKPFSVDTLAYCLHRTVVSTARNTVVQTIRRAERNKVFREGWHGALRMVALDGWEPFSSYHRCCEGCLTRDIKKKDADGVEQKVTQYYHRFVVAMLLDARMDLVLDMEPVRSADLRIEAGLKNVQGHEGELTAAKRLLPRLRTTYGRWIDGVVVDALYANGPFLTLAQQEGLGVICTLKKETDEPLKDALSIWQAKPPDKVLDNPDTHEHIELWDCPGIETLDTYDGKIRVVRGVVTYPKGEQSTWCLGVTGIPASRLSSQQVLAFGRGRWHIENTGFHQFVHRWNFGHVFTHSVHAIQALFWFFLLAFNLLQLFLYRVVRTYGRDQGKDVTQTISRFVDELNDDLARFLVSFVWDSS